MAGNTGGDGMMRALVAEVRRKDEIQRGLAAECSQMEQASAHLERDIQARRDQLQAIRNAIVDSQSACASLVNDTAELWSEVKAMKEKEAAIEASVQAITVSRDMKHAQLCEAKDEHLNQEMTLQESLERACASAKAMHYDSNNKPSTPWGLIDIDESAVEFAIEMAARESSELQAALNDWDVYAREIACQAGLEAPIS